ncbi:tryptophanyl-tRNA synthetase [Candidatus Hydrogenisulfobacillus filiaventi]|uniref:Tryptophan--tRNA ligase n=1 Tax=Candidatus Hydrogenisulfobacillus filiaventi TaxID=2707344 RepID=A0A6F8ZJA6_9FIRM|nr:tryptophanyl-tRNA synthetase [Candidatus Hydrogenisulfobacillus filiaventi]
MASRVFSGVQPSGVVTLGNYLGALRQFVALQDQADCLYCLVDLHALTVPQDPAALTAQTRQLAAVFLAVGLDPARATLFVQSHVPAHTQLAWIMESLVHFGELERMTQFKDKAAGKAVVSASLFTYPALMAADILLYRTDLVPVGEDQKQHLELTRDLAQRFNSRFGETFTVPEPLIPKLGGRIMALDDPTRKMSKSSANPYSYIALSDDPDLIAAKIRRAVTDSGREILYDPEHKPALSNLLTIYALLAEEPVEEVAARFRARGAGYGVFKQELTDVVVAALDPVRRRYLDILEGAELDRVLAAGAARARSLAEPMLARVYERVGLVPPVAG